MGILIKNGLIIDGSGSEAYKADILIKDDKIEKIKIDLETNDAEIIDASNKIISPGFIDLHNHADLNLFEVNKAEPFIMQGITTLLTGVCGVGVSPTNDKVNSYYSRFVSKAFCSSPELFENISEFFNALTRKGISLNVGYLIPQGNVRACVLGTKTRPANKEELDMMKQIVKENMEAGAFGLSTGLVYPPGSVTPTEELIELSKIVSEYGGIYDSHMRNEGAGVIDIGMSELLRIGREANVKVHISHWSTISRYKYEELTERAIQLAHNSREKGIKLSADITVYDDGFTSLSFVLLPTWIYSNFKENLTNPITRKKIKKEVFKKLYSIFLADAKFWMRLIPKSILKKKILPELSKGALIIHSLKNHQLEGKTVFDALAELHPDKNLEDALLDYIRDEDGGIMIRFQQKNEEKSVIPLFKQEFVSPSSDAILIPGGNTHPRAYGAFPRVIARWVNEKKVVSLEEAIRKMTSLPASVLELKDRGLLREGYKADLVVFNSHTIKDKGTLDNGCQHPEGIDYVIINGKITVAKGNHTGVLNGVILKYKCDN